MTEGYLANQSIKSPQALYIMTALEKRLSVVKVFYQFHSRTCSELKYLSPLSQVVAVECLITYILSNPPSILKTDQCPNLCIFVDKFPPHDHVRHKPHPITILMCRLIIT